MTLPPNIAAWPPRWKELWSERAAIIEFCGTGTISRQTAEVRAEMDIRKVAAQERQKEKQTA
jgi:hypothetical protein